MKKNPTPQACFFCKVAGFSAASKGIYPQFWRWLPQDHTGRTLAATGTNMRPLKSKAPPKDKNQTAPSARSVTELRPGSQGLTAIHVDAPQLAEDCVFWCLPYYWKLGPTVICSYDGMHTIAGVVQDAFASLTNRRFSVRAQEYEMQGNK